MAKGMFKKQEEMSQERFQKALAKDHSKQLQNVAKFKTESPVARGQIDEGVRYYNPFPEKGSSDMFLPDNAYSLPAPQGLDARRAMPSGAMPSTQQFAPLGEMDPRRREKWKEAGLTGDFRGKRSRKKAPDMESSIGDHHIVGVDRGKPAFNMPERQPKAVKQGQPPRPVNPKGARQPKGAAPGKYGSQGQPYMDRPPAPQGPHHYGNAPSPHIQQPRTMR